MDTKNLFIFYYIATIGSGVGVITALATSICVNSSFMRCLRSCSLNFFDNFHRNSQYYSYEFSHMMRIIITFLDGYPGYLVTISIFTTAVMIFITITAIRVYKKFIEF